MATTSAQQFLVTTLVDGLTISSDGFTTPSDIFTTSLDTFTTSTDNVTASRASDGEDAEVPEFTPKTFGEVFVASFKILIGIVGFLGNLTVCVAVAKMRAQRNYANNLIVSQAVADLVTSLVLIATTFTEIFPTSPPQNPAMGYLYCVFWHSRIFMFAMFSISTFNLVAISLERYIAVIHPILYSQNFTGRTAVMFAVTAWLLAPLMQVILGFLQFTFTDGECEFIFLSFAAQATTGVILFLWDFFGPCIIMAFCFTRISIQFSRQAKRVGAAEMSTTTTSTVSTTVQDNAAEGNTDNAPTKKSGRGRAITKTLVIVFLVYVICWSPDQFLFLQWNLGGYIDFGGVIHSLVVIMAMLNSACNPFIYALRYKKYREAMKALYTCKA